MKKIFFILLFSLSLPVLAQTKYRIHTCEKNNRCIDKDPIVLSFRVDSNNDKVLFQVYENGKIINTSIMGNDDCKVFDTLNWYCRSNIEGKILYEYSMKNGNLTYQRFQPVPGLNDSPKRYYWAERL